MKRYYIVGGQSRVMDPEDASVLTVLVVDLNDVECKNVCSYNTDEKVIGRRELPLTKQLKEHLSVQNMTIQALRKLARADCVFGQTRLLKASGAELKRLLTETNVPEVFVILSEVYGLRGKGEVYTRDDRAGYEIVLLRAAGNRRDILCAYKSENAFAEWDATGKGKRICANASVDRSSAKQGAVIRFKDAEHSGVFMSFGTFDKAAVQKAVENSEDLRKALLDDDDDAPENEPEEVKMDGVTSPYTREQLIELGKGKASGVDVSVYANPEISAARMKRLRHFMERGLNVTALGAKTPGMSDEIFDLYCILCQTGDISSYVYDNIDVAAVYTLYAAYASGDSAADLLSRAKGAAGDSTITVAVLESVMHK